MSAAIRNDAGVYPVIGVLGPRQSGKTTLVQALFPEYRYANLEDPELREFAQTDPKGFLRHHASGMVIDEFQHVPELLSHIRVIADSHPQPGRFVLTGSQNYLMMERISQSLAGRISLFTLLPLALSELIGVGHTFDSYEQVLLRGLFPRLYRSDASDTAIDPNRYYGNYVQTYVDRDLRQLRNVMDLPAFQRVLRMCAGRTAGVLNLSSIADDVGVSHNTVKAWIGLLQTSHLVFLLPSYHRNFNKQITKNPKLYFTDPGLASYLLGIESISAIDTHPLKGALFENMVIVEFLKFRLNAGREPKLFFWRDKRGVEVDLILDWDASPRLVEIKAGRTVTQAYFKGLDHLAGLDPTFGAEHRFVVYGGDQSQNRSNARVRGWRCLGDLGNLDASG